MAYLGRLQYHERASTILSIYPQDDAFFFFLPTHLHYKISLLWFIMNVGGVGVMVSFGGSSPAKVPQC